MRHLTSLVVAGCLLTVVLPSARAQQVPLGDVADRAVAESKLTLPGSVPFHLTAKIAEIDSPDSDLKADVDIVWVSPEKWRRTIRSPEFDQTLIVNGDKVLEQDTGDYYPVWLREFVTALLDPLPLMESLKRMNLQIAKPSGAYGAKPSCAMLEFKAGVPPAQIGAYDVFCFESNGLLEGVTTPPYSVEFENYKGFKSKRVARLLATFPQPGISIEANVTELSEITSVDESQFAISQPTPKEMQLQSVYIPEADLKKISLQNPEIIWPPVQVGKTSGVLSMYVSIDRSGRVREALPINSDNPDLDDSVGQQLRQWRFKPAVSNRAPVQVESMLTLAFDANAEKPVTILADADARKLATNAVEPQVPPGTAVPGAAFTVRVLVALDGKLLAIENPNKLPRAVMVAASNALKEWHFQPYTKDGQPDLYRADITFQLHGQHHASKKTQHGVANPSR